MLADAAIVCTAGFSSDGREASMELQSTTVSAKEKQRVDLGSFESSLCDPRFCSSNVADDEIPTLCMLDHGSVTFEVQSILTFFSRDPKRRVSTIENLDK